MRTGVKPDFRGGSGQSKDVKMRRKPAGRLHQIADAAIIVLSQQGYRLTQMADVAREAGLSAGALYSYVEGKEALLHLALAHAFELEFDESDLPYRVSSPDETLHLLKREFKRPAVWPVLSKKIRAGSVPLQPADLAGVAAELYDTMHARRRRIWLLDRCARDVPEIADLYVKQVKAQYLKDLAAFIAAGQVQGLFNRDIDSPTAARALLEMTAWLAMHRLRDALPLQVDEDQVRQAAVLLIGNALHRPEGRSADVREGSKAKSSRPARKTR